MSDEPRAAALEWMIKQFRVGRARFQDPAVALEIAKEELRAQRELDSLRITNVVDTEEFDVPQAVNFAKRGDTSEEGK